MDRKQLLARHDELVALRQPEEAVWRQIARVIAPDEQAFGPRETPKSDPYGEIYDSSPLYAADAFAGGLFNQATNPTEDWFDLGYEDPDLKQWSPARDYAAAVKRLLQRSIAPGQSGFYVEAYPWFANLGAFGLSALTDEPDHATGAFVERAIPLGEFYIDVDAWGRVDTAHRSFRLRGRQAAQRWPGLDGVREDREYQIIHAVWPNPDYDPTPGRVGQRAMRHASLYVSPDLPALMRRGGFYEMPYHVISWSRRAGRVYSRGPGHFARADASMLQEMERSHAVAMQMRAEPPILTTEEAALTASDIRPNQVLYGAISDAGKPLAQPLALGEDMGPSLQHAEQKRQAIREAFLFSLLNLVNRPQMTATEVMAFQEERLRLMAPNLVRVQSGLAGFVSRRLRQLDRMGLLPPAPPDVIDRSLTIEFVSPLAKAQRAATGKAALQWAMSVTQFAPIQPDVVDAVDFDALAQVTHDAMGPPPSVIRAPDAIAERRQQRAAMQQQQAQIEQAQAMAGVYADVSHARQAETRANQRSDKK